LSYSLSAPAAPYRRETETEKKRRQRKQTFQRGEKKRKKERWIFGGKMPPLQFFHKCHHAQYTYHRQHM
jgi:hypothetical protein